MSDRPPIAMWREAIRDDVDLDQTAVLVAYVLSTYMDSDGVGHPGKTTLAEGLLLSGQVMPPVGRGVGMVGRGSVERDRGVPV